MSRVDVANGTEAISFAAGSGAAALRALPRVPPQGRELQHAGPEQQRAPAVTTEAAATTFTTEDGSRFVLVPLGGPPVVHWVFAVPAGPAEDPLGRPGLAAAAVAAAFGAGGAEPPFASELARCPALGPHCTRVPHGVLLAFETGSDLLPRLAQQLVGRRRAVLAGRVTVEPVAPQAPSSPWPSFAADPSQVRLGGGHAPSPRRTALLEELAALHFLGHPFGSWYAMTEPPPGAGFGVAAAAAIADRQSRRAERAREDELQAYAAREALARVLRPERTVHVLAGGFDVAEVEPVLRREFGTREPDAPPPLRELASTSRGERRSTIRGPRAAVAIALPLVADVPLDMWELVAAWLAADADAALPGLLRASGRAGVRVGARVPWPAAGPEAAMLIMVVGEALAEAEAAAPLSSRPPPSLSVSVERALAQLAREGPTQEALQRATAHVQEARAAWFAAPAGLALHVAARALAGESGVRALRSLPQPSPAEMAALVRTLLGGRRTTVVQEADETAAASLERTDAVRSWPEMPEVGR